MAEKFTTGFVNSLMAKFIQDFQNGVLAIYSGTQPASADDAEAGELLCLITNGGGEFTAGSAENGLNFEPSPVTGTASKAEDETWTGTALKDGTATWFRFYANDYTTGASENAKRFDGRVSTGTGAELQLGNVNMTKDGKVTINAFPVSLPKVGV
jgi:hypothetical protein